MSLLSAKDLPAVFLVLNYDTCVLTVVFSSCFIDILFWLISLLVLSFWSAMCRRLNHCSVRVGHCFFEGMDCLSACILMHSCNIAVHSGELWTKIFTVVVVVNPQACCTISTRDSWRPLKTLPSWKEHSKEMCKTMTTVEVWGEQRRDMAECFSCTLLLIVLCLLSGHCCDNIVKLNLFFVTELEARKEAKKSWVCRWGGACLFYVLCKQHASCHLGCMPRDFMEALPLPIDQFLILICMVIRQLQLQPCAEH